MVRKDHLSCAEFHKVAYRPFLQPVEVTLGGKPSYRNIATAPTIDITYGLFLIFSQDGLKPTFPPDVCSGSARALRAAWGFLLSWPGIQGELWDSLFPWKVALLQKATLTECG